MELVEIRDLDGPNLFALHPVLKLELRVDDGERVAPVPLLGYADPAGDADAVTAGEAIVRELHRRIGLPAPEVGHRWMDEPGHLVIFWRWEWRETALGIGQATADALRGIAGDGTIDELAARLEADRAKQDVPLWIRDAQRTIPAVGITGTNGKTTTTRLLAHIVHSAGQHVGWTSTSGVYIDGECVIQGDYTGPAGARRVLAEPGVEVAVLETARGGILLRGVACESNDVGVFLNVSSDHLGLHGVTRVETLAEVKSVVVRITRPGGLVVLNADDPLVMAQRDRVRAPVLLFSQDEDSPLIAAQVRSGGRAVVREGDTIVLRDGARRETVLPLAEIPLTFGGIARHMVENALGATGAALGLGYSLDVIRNGLRTFRSDVRSNTGRLNVFRLDGRTIVVDYAHNESGLEALLAFTRALMAGSGKVAAVIGTAGDRQDEVLHGLGHIAARDADLVLIKDNPGYLRGREPGGSVAQMEAGVIEAGGRANLVGEYAGEVEALVAALDATGEGDAIAVMCVEEQLGIFRLLRDRGAREWE